MQNSTNTAQNLRSEVRHKRRRIRRIWRNCVSAMACVVVFCVTYALILPAITMEKDTFCGMEAHIHEAQCYEGNSVVCDPAGDTGLPILHTHDTYCYDGENLICTLAELAGHVHTDSCYETVTTEAHTHDESCNGSARGALLCTEAEDAGHTHTDACYIPGQTLLCTEAEREGHSHGDTCYTVGSQLTCTTAEGEGHTHTEDCMDADGNVTCTIAQTPAHTHGDSCYGATKTLTCEIPEDPGHTHTASCYERVLNCGQAERKGHRHTDACYEMVSTIVCGKEEIAETVTVRNLICTQTQIAPHTHDGSCSDESGSLICTIQNAVVHQHTEDCIQPSQSEENLICEQQVHEHTLICYSDPTADLETAEDWEKTFADLERTGDWHQDVVAIAKTQLGYEESTKNYIVEGESTKGYTRYGDWYGVPYGDWCAMFASFCLDYAGVEGMPLDCNCPNWINTLNNQNLYHVSGGYAPQSGDLIFFDWNADGSSDHVGIVVEFTPAEGDTPATVRTIEGNSGNCVKYNEYNMDDSTIMGYGALPTQLTEEERAQVDYVIALIDAMPSADEIDAKIEEFEEAEDYEGEEAWLTEVYQQVAEAYYYYDQLSDTLKSYVTNADKLLELEYIWSVTTYANAINSATPDKTWYTSTKEFVELNLYDYNGYVNANYWSKNIWYPGFQWNGGAYSNDSGDADPNDYRYTYGYQGIGIPYAITDRNYVDSIDFGNSLITNLTYGYGNYGYYTKAVNATGVGYLDHTKTRPANWLYGNSTEGYTNKPIGYSTTDLTESPKVMKYELVSGYPALSDGTMLDYLFKDGTPATKMNTESIDGLFQQNKVSGEYAYNSRLNHAEYTDNFFQLYDEIITPNFILYPFGNFLPLNTISDSSKATQVGAFNRIGGMSDYVSRIITDLKNNTEGLDSDWESSQQQLITMLEEYQENWSIYSRTINGVENKWVNLSPANAIRDFFWKDTSGGGDGPTGDTDFITQDFLNRMYNIDWDVQTNFFFGMEMKMNIMQPKDGLTGNDNGNNAAQNWATAADGTLYLTGEPDGIPDYPMKFYFTGDDDVWVYIDGVLFLDLSGIHRHVGGEIDFVNGQVHYYALDTVNGGDVSDTPYKTFTFAQILTNAGKSTDVLNDNGTFQDYTSHAFNFYYMERGSGSSVCRLNFNFPLLRKNTISVSKENVTTTGVAADEVVVGNPDYYFNLVTPSNELFVGPGSVTGVTQYKVEDSDGNILKNSDGTDKIFTTDQYGIFTLKAGQTAYFEGITEDKGKYFVQELIKEEDNVQYPEVYVNEQESRYNLLIDWSYRTYFSDGDDDKHTGPYGYKWYGRSGYETDPSNSASFHFEQQNRFDVAKLGKLQITKKLIEMVPSRAITYYKMYVTLDGEPLAKGTTYDVNGSTRTVTDTGYIELAAGETATISNIISGTKFEVTEAAASAAGYTVSYDVDGVNKGNQSATGEIHVGDSQTVAVTVTNSDSGAQVEIPVTKTFNKADSLTREFTFALQQVTDASGETLVDGGANLTTTIATPTATSGSFGLTYFSKEFDVGQTKLYYKITETDHPDTLSNSQAFIAEVTITKAEGSTEITADCDIYPLGGSTAVDAAAFVNTITGDLKLEKIVDGGTEAQTNDTFSFTVELTKGDSGLTELRTTYKALLCSVGEEPVEKELTLNNGKFSFTGVKHGEYVVIYGIPIGTEWTITEDDPAGYTVKTAVTENGTTVNGTDVETSGTIVAGDTSVVYTNLQLYELPETGGTGTQMYTMAGLMLMLIGTAYLLYRCRKRRREVS